MEKPSHPVFPQRTPYQIVFVALYLLLASCSSAPLQVPKVEEVLPAAAGTSALASMGADQVVNVHVDGTLSMRGFAAPKDGRFAQFLQDLDLALSSKWSRDRVRYYRFGSVIEEVPQRPFYVSASQEAFYQTTKEYADTRIDNVFRKSSPDDLNLVLTDLFENNLDIAGIQEALRAAAFPTRSSLAIWQWEMPFSGSIFDFDFRSSQGRQYRGLRPLYLLALGPEQSLKALRQAIEAVGTTGRAQFVLLSAKIAANPQNWLTVTQTQRAGLLSNYAGDARSAPYKTFRPSSGCSSAELSLNADLIPTSDNIVQTLKPHASAYEAQLFSVARTSGKWSATLAASPQVGVIKGLMTNGSVTKGTRLTVQVDCALLTATPIHLLRVRRLGSAEDVIVPDWVEASNANSMDFNAAIQRGQPAWGDKTLNLAPLVRGLAGTAVDGSTIASAYFYFVKN